jgi:hypothetical protein
MIIGTPLPVNAFVRGYDPDNLPSRLNALEGRIDYKLSPWQQWDKWSNHPAFAFRPLRLGSGEWHINSSLVVDTPGVQVVGEGIKTVMKSTGPSTLLTISADSVAVIGVRFVLNESAFSGPLLSITGNDVLIANCMFESTFADNAIVANLADRLRIENCYFLPAARDDVMSITDSDDVIINGNRIVYPLGPANHSVNLIASTMPPTDVNRRCNGALISGNHFGSVSVRYNSNGAHNVGDPAALPLGEYARLNNAVLPFTAY